MKRVLFYCIFAFSLIGIFTRVNMAIADCGSVPVGSCASGVCTQGTAACTCDEVPSPTCLANVASCMSTCKSVAECDACGKQSDCPIVPMNIICPSRGCTTDCGCGCGTKACSVAYCDKPGVEWFCIKETQYVNPLSACPVSECVGPADCSGGGGGECIPDCRNTKCGKTDPKCGEMCGSPFDAGCITLTGSCVGSTSVVATASLSGNIFPIRYYWSKLNSTGSQWIKVYTEECSAGNCKKSYTYTLSGQKETLSLAIDGQIIGGGDSRYYSGQSNSLPIDCSVPPSTSKCGLDSENYLVCKLDGTGTGVACNTDNDCTCGGCLAGQSNPHNACVSGTCSSVNSCGVNDCTSCPITTPSCSITNFDITPTFRTILLGGSFKASWNTADCTSCTLSCAPGAPGCGIAASGSPVSLSGTNYSIKPTQSGKYSYTLTCISPLTSETRGAGVIPGDKPFSVINFFWHETPAFLELLIDKLFQH